MKSSYKYMALAGVVALGAAATTIGLQVHAQSASGATTNQPAVVSAAVDPIDTQAQVKGGADPIEKDTAEVGTAGDKADGTETDGTEVEGADSEKASAADVPDPADTATGAAVDQGDGDGEVQGQ